MDIGQRIFVLVDEQPGELDYAPADVTRVCDDGSLNLHVLFDSPRTGYVQSVAYVDTYESAKAFQANGSSQIYVAFGTLPGAAAAASSTSTETPAAAGVTPGAELAGVSGS